MTDGNTQAQHLLQLELDGRANLNDLVVQVFSVGDGGRELSSWINKSNSEIDSCGLGSQKRTLGKTGTEQTRDLLNESLGRQESVILFGELLNKLLVLVKSARREV